MVVVVEDELPLLDELKVDIDKEFSTDCKEVCVTIPVLPNIQKQFNTSVCEPGGDEQQQCCEGGDEVQKAVMAGFQEVVKVGRAKLGKRASGIDPFVNGTPWRVAGAYAHAKMALLLPLLLVRLLLVGVILVVGYVATKVALAGWEGSTSTQVLPKWSRKLMGVTRLCGRGLLLCFGFHWIRRKGKAAPKETAPIVVSNHVSFIDPIFYFYELFPSFVSKAHDKIFLAGPIIRSMQVIPVDKTSEESRKYATSEIKRRAMSREFPSVLLFPEGTTTNGRSLISFKLGAFAPALPIQPVVIRYPFAHFDVSWGDISLRSVLFRMLTQFNNFMEVEYLPVVYPSAEDVQNPVDFAERVRHVMAEALRVPVTEHTYGDLMLSVSAQKLCLSSPASYMVEMGSIEKVLGLRAGEVKRLLEKFAAMNPDYCGTVSTHQFLEWHNLPRCWVSKQIFNLFDKSGQGSITFYEFVAASGSISKSQEFKSQMKAAYNACKSQSSVCISALELQSCLKLSMPSITSAKVKVWFKRLDLYKDGVVSWEEFQTFIEANPELLPIFMVGTF